MFFRTADWEKAFNGHFVLSVYGDRVVRNVGDDYFRCNLRVSLHG
jgi:hypothetical protein